MPWKAATSLSLNAAVRGRHEADPAELEIAGALENPRQTFGSGVKPVQFTQKLFQGEAICSLEF